MLLDDDDINKRGIIDIRHGSVLPILLFFCHAHCPYHTDNMAGGYLQGNGIKITRGQYL
jgi:hypothetical protein